MTGAAWTFLGCVWVIIFTAIGISLKTIVKEQQQ